MLGWAIKHRTDLPKSVSVSVIEMFHQLEGDFLPGSAPIASGWPTIHSHRGVCKFRTRCHGSASSRSLAGCRIRWCSSEMAVPRVRRINPSRLTCWNEPDSDGLCHDGALVSDDVHVLATVVNKRHPCRVHVRRAAGIVRLILRHRSCRDKDERMTRMRMPACGPSRQPDIAQDSSVRHTLRPL